LSSSRRSPSSGTHVSSSAGVTNTAWSCMTDTLRSVAGRGRAASRPVIACAAARPLHLALRPVQCSRQCTPSVAVALVDAPASPIARYEVENRVVVRDEDEAPRLDLLGFVLRVR